MLQRRIEELSDKIDSLQGLNKFSDTFCPFCGQKTVDYAGICKSCGKSTI